MPPKRASKRQAAKRPAPVVAPKQRRAESRPISTALPESSTQPLESSSQLSPTELGAIISRAISGALQSVGIVLTNLAPAERDSGTNTQSTLQPTVVEDAASKEIEALTNTVAVGRLTFPTEKPEETFSSVTFDLESRVSDRVKAKIWANEYVDFGSVLTVSPDESKYRISVTDDHDHTSLCLEHVKPKRRSLTIDQWLTAFNVFVAVYTIKTPSAISSLKKYCEVVRNIAAKQGNWRYYDEQFRFLRQSKPDRYPWDNVAWELWHQALHSSLTTSRPNSNNDFRTRRPNQRPFHSFPKGVCRRFHAGQLCSGCNFKHSCFKCVDLSTRRPNVLLPDLTQTTVQHLTCPPGVTVRDELLLSCGPTPVKPVQLAFYLRGYNNSISDYLIQGFVHGFSVRYLGSLIAMRSQNLKSAKDNPTSVTEKLSKELTAGRIVGPLDVPPFDPFRASPLGIIPKTSPGEPSLLPGGVIS